MNAKFPTKHPVRLTAIPILVALMLPVGAYADDGNLTQQLQTQQEKSSFQLKLQQIEEQARRRAAAGQGASSAAPAAPAAPSADMGDATESVRLSPMGVDNPPSIDVDPQSATEFQARQAYERDQQRILDNRQQRSALLEDSRAAGADDYADRRESLNRFKSQSRQQALQRKLRN